MEAFLAIIRGERRGPLAACARLGLRVASWPYGLGVGVRNRRFDRGKNVQRVGVPVVSVGNLTLGGTGKTPCVEFIARFFRDLGVQVAILSRGYGSEAGRNDEAMVLEENLPDVPHLQGADRVSLANMAIEELESELLVLDDGFQHRRLHRDLDIVLIDATAPPQRDHLFPRGTLRESVKGLRRANAVLLTRCDQVDDSQVQELRDWLHTRFPALLVATTEHRPQELQGEGMSESPESLRNKVVAAFCGIGNPVSFRRTLDSLGANVIAFRTFADHHAYTREDVDDLRAWANQLPADAVIATTQKDAVKLRLADLANRPVCAVRIGLAFRDGQEAFEALLNTLNVGDGSPAPDDFND